MATNTDLRILFDVVLKQNFELKKQLEESKAKNAETKGEMEMRDVVQLESYVGSMTKKSYKDFVRVLNTCECCPRHMEKKIKSEDFDKEEVIIFKPTERSEEELYAEIENCECTCRHETRRLYYEYCETCVVCDD